MSSYSKGQRSREEIIDRARELFNEHGIHLTLVKLAETMETTLGRVTHHFNNKDQLFIAITQDYEKKLQEMRAKRPQGPFGLDSYSLSASQIMDLQYDYRCALWYIIVSLPHQKQMESHVLEAYGNNRKAIIKTIEALVHAGSLKPTILQKGTYEVFLFQLTNLYTNWIINLEIYDNDKSYHDVKPIYLKGLLSIYLPFLTEKGFKELEEKGIF